MELDININIENRLPALNRILEIGDYNTLVRECCILLEDILRKSYTAILPAVDFKTRDFLFQAEREIGANKKGIDSFGLGEIAGLYRKTKFIDVLSQYLKIDMKPLKAFDINHIVTTRNSLVHKSTDHYTISYHEAKLIYEYVMNWLAYLGYANIESSGPASFSRSQKRSNMPEKKEGRKKTASAYSSSYGAEDERLANQAKTTLKLDEKAIKQALDSYGRPDSPNLTALDVGCAAGHVTVTRFDPALFSSVIGIDINEHKIKDAQSKADKVFSFEQMNCESDDFLASMKNLMEEKGIEKFDFIFSAYTLHHLKNPLKVLKKLRMLLKPGGFVILRSADDGSKVAYPDDGLVQRIIEMTLSVEGVSDRLNGRKLFSYLVNTGFENISVFHEITDTARLNFEEKHRLFSVSFMYRKDYFRKRLENDPDNHEYAEDLEQIEDMLESLEDCFSRKDFYYSHTNYAVIGQLN